MAAPRGLWRRTFIAGRALRLGVVNVEQPPERPSERPAREPSGLLRCVFVLPLAVAAAALLAKASALGFSGAVLLAWLSAALWFGAVLRYVALMVALGLWVAAFCVLCYAAGVAGAGLLAQVLLVVACVAAAGLAVRLGGYWGRARYASLAARGRGIREWEWVYVGRHAARSLLPHATPNWPIHLTGGLVLAQTVVAGFVAAVLPDLGWARLGFIFGAGFGALTCLALWRRAPVAYPMVLAMLCGALPLSVPLLWFWADGVRPNLIYRHRFERLVPATPDRSDDACLTRF